MNYTNYVLHKNPFQPELLISNKPYLKQITIAVVLPAAIVGMVVNISLVPCAMLIDITRLIRLKHYQYCAYKRKQRYAIFVLRSLDHKVDKYIVQLLIAA